MGRSEAGIRNLRYRKGLFRKVEDEIKALLQRRDELQSFVDGFESKQEELLLAIEELEEKKQSIERYLQLDKNQFELMLTEALVNLKEEKPELFILSGPEQVGLLVRFILNVFK